MGCIIVGKSHIIVSCFTDSVDRSMLAPSTCMHRDHSVQGSLNHSPTTSRAAVGTSSEGISPGMLRYCVRNPSSPPLLAAAARFLFTRPARPPPKGEVSAKSICCWNMDIEIEVHKECGCQ